VSEAVLYDVAGPRARRRTLIWSLIATVGVVALLVFAALRLADNEQFDADKWTPFFESSGVRQVLWDGLLATLKAAGIALGLALIVGTLLGVGRLSSHRWVRWPAGFVVEVFRALPLLLLIFFFFLAFPLAFGINLPPLWSLVFGLTLYNGAVIAEIVRAGVIALPRGQSEAAYAIGLRPGQVMRIVLLPQAFRIMLPALISQLVVLLKDSTLGFLIGYRDLLRASGVIRREFDNPVQTYLVVAVIFILVNSLLSWVAHRVEARQRRRYGTRTVGTADVETGLEGQPGPAPGQVVAP
jgi:glutamate transport system permease protein